MEKLMPKAMHVGYSGVGFPDLGTTDIWGWIILCWRWGALSCTSQGTERHLWPPPAKCQQHLQL